MFVLFKLASKEGTDKSVQMQRLRRAFAAQMHKVCFKIKKNTQHLRPTSLDTLTWAFIVGGGGCLNFCDKYPNLVHMPVADPEGVC